MAQAPIHPIAAAAQHLAQANVSFIPTRADTSKGPAVAWKEFQSRKPTLADQTKWFGTENPRNYGVAVVTGRVSGNLEMTEIEGKISDRIPEITKAFVAAGERALWQRLMTSWVEQSPTGGMHWIYRLDGENVPGNTKIATNADGEVLAETRGEGGYFVAAPTDGTHHSTGQGWVALGLPAACTTLTATERETFHRILRETFHEGTETPKHPQTGNHTQGTRKTFPAAVEGQQAGVMNLGVKPGDEFETKTDWADILTPHGWSLHSTQADGTRFWVRPGKKPRDGHSASTGHADDRDRLYVFSSSVQEFDTDTPYTKFKAYSILNHGGDDTKAAKHLAANGFGTPTTLNISLDDMLGTNTTGGQQWQQKDKSSTQYHNQNQQPISPSSAESTAPSPGTGTSQATSGQSDSKTAPSTSKKSNNLEIPAYTEFAFTQAFIAEHGKNIRYNTDRGRFYYWGGKRWVPQPDTGGIIKQHALAFAAQLPDEDDAALKRLKASMLSNRGVTAALNLLKVDPRVACTSDDFDTRPWELNTPAGIVDLRTGSVRAHDPAMMHSKITTVAPVASSEAPIWSRFLQTTFNADSALIGYMQRLLGYSATGAIREHVFAFAYGTGGNGKSVFYDACVDVLGDYATVMPAGFLMKKSYQEHSTELADLKGMRLVVGSEINQGEKFDEAKLKSLTGGDRIKARHMHQDFFTFTPTHHLHLMGNHLPQVEAGGDSIWRRMNQIPFVHTVPAEERNERLPEQLRTEEAGQILAWIIEGAKMYHQDGLQAPEAVRAATAAYAQSQDTVGEFLSQECTMYPGNEFYTASVKQFRMEYEAWCQGEGVSPLKGRSLTAALASHGVLVGRNAPRAGNGNDRVYGGVRLNSHEESLGNSPWQ